MSSVVLQKTLQQVQHVEKLVIGRWIMEILSSSKEVGDCKGGLPDSFIHWIISFFPSTNDAFESDHYKAWHKWTHDFPIINFVCNEKLVVDSKHIPLAYMGPRFSFWICYAIQHVEVEGISIQYWSLKIKIRVANVGYT
ncbi:hypothetical protein M5689_000144 [Euphorbia peplus]|nr:hypothetical protein M5689_000144 [Euphorbia peplus]